MPDYKLIEGKVNIGILNRGNGADQYMFYWETENGHTFCCQSNFDEYAKSIKLFSIESIQLLNTGTKTIKSNPLDDESFSELEKQLAQ